MTLKRSRRMQFKMLSQDTLYLGIPYPACLPTPLGRHAGRVRIEAGQPGDPPKISGLPCCLLGLSIYAISQQ